MGGGHGNVLLGGCLAHGERLVFVSGEDRQRG